jgi:hypothetical protein
MPEAAKGSSDSKGRLKIPEARQEERFPDTCGVLQNPAVPKGPKN